MSIPDIFIGLAIFIACLTGFFAWRNARRDIRRLVDRVEELESANEFKPAADPRASWRGNVM